MLDTVKEFWAIVSAFIAFGIWLVRMEARVNGNSKEILRLERSAEGSISRLERQIEKNQAAAATERAEQMDMLREVQRDIKTLLSRNGTIQHFSDRTIPPR